MTYCTECGKKCTSHNEDSRLHFNQYYCSNCGIVLEYSGDNLGGPRYYILPADKVTEELENEAYENQVKA
jgi:hypothetical protein